MRKWIFFIGLLAFCLLIGTKIYNKFYAYESYPNGNTKKSIFFHIFDNRYKFREYYESGELAKIYFTENDKVNGTVIEYFKNGNIKTKSNYSNDLMQGDLLTYKEDGKLLALNIFRDGTMYYKRVYKYNGTGVLKDSVDAILPLIHDKRISDKGDSLYINVSVETQGTPYQIDSLDLFYELYDTIKPNGIYPYMPSNIKQISNKDNFILSFPLQQKAKLYDLVLIIRQINGEERIENDPIVLKIR